MLRNLKISGRLWALMAIFLFFTATLVAISFYNIYRINLHVERIVAVDMKGKDLAINQRAATRTSLRAVATQMNQNFQMISSSVEEMSTSVGEVARNASDASKIAREANQTAAAANINIKQLGEDARCGSEHHRNLDHHAGWCEECPVWRCSLTHFPGVWSRSWAASVCRISESPSCSHVFLSIYYWSQS